MQQSSGRKRPGRRKAGSHPIDIHVGARVRLRRNMLGLSQEKLGEALGLTFQQVQKYERGTNRIGASRLLEIAHVLDVPVAFFYDDVDPVRAPPIPRRSDEFGVFESEGDYLRQEESIELVTAYYTITDDKVRRNLFGLAKALWEVNNPSVKKARKAQRRSVHIPSHQPAKP